MSTAEINIAPHLERALEAMSKDLSIDRQALINQAVFAWLRINGYVSPGAQQPVAAPAVAAAMAVAIETAPPISAPPVAPVAPVAPVVAAPPAPPPAPVVPAPVTAQIKAHVPGSSPSVVAESAQKIEAPPAPPPEPVVAAPVPSSPSGGQLSALARMKEIAADLEALTRPWPDWVAQEEQEEEDEEEEQEEEDESPPQDEQEEDEAPEQEQQEEDEEDKPEPSDPFAEEPRDPFEAELPEANTGEREEPAPPAEDESVGESTVVLKSVPIVLYLEREGSEEIRVDAERFIIGRGPTCHLIIDSPRVSREHAVITRQGIRYFLEDLNSSNGTWYGEERVGTREIESGDVISLGNEPVTFILRGE